MILRAKGITVVYGKVIAVRDASFDVDRGRIVTLIGSNGAGKSTILKTISGLHSPIKGEIVFQDKKIDRLSANEIVKLGISQVPEGRRLFPRMTSIDNLSMGAYLRRGKTEFTETLEKIFLYFPV